MDDYTWRLHLRARKISSYNRTLTMLVIVFFALAVGSVLWYFFIHARSPKSLFFFCVPCSIVIPSNVTSSPMPIDFPASKALSFLPAAVQK